MDTLRQVSERYKSLSDWVFVAANMMGELKLRVESDEVKVETKWVGLVNPPLGTRHLSLMKLVFLCVWIVSFRFRFLLFCFTSAVGYLSVDVLDPEAVSITNHPSTRRPPNAFTQIKILAKDWSNLLKISVVAKSMLACTSPFPSAIAFRGSIYPLNSIPLFEGEG